MWTKVIALVFLIGCVAEANAAPQCQPLSATSYALWDDLDLHPPAVVTQQIALVIGNDYDKPDNAFKVPKLNNAGQDAQTMSDLLTARNYQVVCLLDVRKNDLLLAVDRFSVTWMGLIANKITPMGIIYFAGHGGETQPDANPFILPSDFDQNDDDPKQLNELPLGTILEFLPDNNSGGRYAVAPVIIIDACRTKEAIAQDADLQNVLGGSLHPYEKAATLGYLTTTDSDFQLEFSTSGGHPAGDGPPGAGTNGAYVSAFRQRLADHLWDKVTDPDLAPFIADLQSDMQAVPGGRFPATFWPHKRRRAPICGRSIDPTRRPSTHGAMARLRAMTMPASTLLETWKTCRRR